MSLALHRQPHGFSLIEVLVQPSLLLLVCLATSSLLATAHRGERVVAHQDALADALDQESARLRSLPYVAPYQSPSDSPSPTATPSILGESFPHARPGLNTPGASFAGTVDPHFTSTTSVGDVVIQREARFVVHTGDSYSTLTANALSDWALWESSLPPAGHLEVRLTAADGQRIATRVIYLTSLPVRTEDVTDVETLDE